MIESRMEPVEFAQLKDVNRAQVAELLDKFLRDHSSSVESANVHLLQGDPVDVIPKFTREENVDLVVMGTVARSGVSGLLMRNTAEQILSGIACSVLAVKPAEFVCPICVDEPRNNFPEYGSTKCLGCDSSCRPSTSAKIRKRKKYIGQHSN